jgi:hypothetical protein
MYIPFEEKTDDKIAKEFKGVTDLLLSLDGRINPNLIDLLLENAFNHYSHNKKSEMQIIHDTVWATLPIFDLEDEEGEEELIDDNPLNVTDDMPEEPEILLPNPFDVINRMNKNLNNSNKKSKKNLTL